MSSNFRSIRSITMKRDHIHLTGDDKYGHWWFEIGEPGDHNAESYGWWPERRVALAGTMIGIRGELNGQTSFRGKATRDPNHGEDAEEEFHPVVAISDPRTDDEIADCLRTFARSCRGEWRWTFGSGLNCHSFQEEAMKHCRLDKPVPQSYV